MNAPSTRSLCAVGLLGMLFAVSAPFLRAQSGTPGPTAVVEGKVHDAQGHPVVAALISLEAMDPRQALVTTTDGQGQFRFGAVPVGSYTARAKLQGYGEAKEGPFLLRERETKSISFELASVQEKQAEKDPSKSLAFSDQPAFTVAGVTDTTALGGHGSGPIVRNSNALSKETASLAREAAGQPAGSARDLSHTGPAEEAAIRAKLAEKDNADLHAQLAEIEESEGHPLEAVKEYQRAAEMQPSEPHLFAWGAELLLHHAPEPAIEVFSKGHRLYPQSTRMLLGLGAAYYAERSKEQAEQTVLDASDLNPADPTPYLFLGRLQAFEKIEPVGWTDRMKRFVALHPQSAMAHYLYAVALMKQSEHPDHLDVAEGELETAIELDPRLGDAYLQLGILRTDRDDFSGAVSALQKAIESTPLPEEAHYRLAQVYRRMGNTEKANQEIAQFKQISEQKDEQAERERHEIPQFVYTLR